MCFIQELQIFTRALHKKRSLLMKVMLIILYQSKLYHNHHKHHGIHCNIHYLALLHCCTRQPAYFLQGSLHKAKVEKILTPRFSFMFN